MMQKHKQQALREAIGFFILAGLFVLIWACSGCSHLPDIPYWPPSEWWGSTNTLPEPIPPQDYPTNNLLADEIPLDSIVWRHTDVSGWPATAEIVIAFEGRDIIYHHDKLGIWPAKVIPDTSGNKKLYGNPWVGVQVGDKWEFATWEWLREGQNRKPKAKIEPGHTKAKGVFKTFRPVSGETYAFMVSTLARGKSRTVNERSRIVKAVWP
jgi:hypothetical protein